jgi:CheY-like chemotaxis protein
VAGQAADGAQAVREAARLGPDVVLMDVRMPVMDGLAAAREILADGKPPSVTRRLIAGFARQRRDRQPPPGVPRSAGSW